MRLFKKWSSSIAEKFNLFSASPPRNSSRIDESSFSRVSAARDLIVLDLE